MLMRTDTAAVDLIVRARRILAHATTEELVLLEVRLMWCLMVLPALLPRMPSLKVVDLEAGLSLVLDS